MQSEFPTVAVSLLGVACCLVPFAVVLLGGALVLVQAEFWRRIFRR